VFGLDITGGVLQKNKSSILHWCNSQVTIRQNLAQGFESKASSRCSTL